MIYKIRTISAARQVLGIELQLDCQKHQTIYAQMPAWRPGRYQLQQYAKEVRSLKVEDTSTGAPIHSAKASKDRWEIHTGDSNGITIVYELYARKMDAGSCWVDGQQLYLNFINFALLIEGYAHLPITVALDIPHDYQIACSLAQSGHHQLCAANYAELVDAPLIASAQLHRIDYQVEGHDFTIWLNGAGSVAADELKRDFEKFTRKQIVAFGQFPTQHYHFLFQMLPYRHYHGVEHANSTVITLGPGNLMHERSHYLDLLGIASHELIHTWNVSRLRPAAFLTYDFSREQYFDTGFIVEGFTTYLGDLMLVKAQVISEQEYLEELNKMLKRHMHNDGRLFRPLTEASVDLWMDGYQKSEVPRTVSIYVKGALVALLLDLAMTEKTNGKHDLMAFVRALWQEFFEKAKGYTLRESLQTLQKLTGIDFSSFFSDYVEGTAPLLPELQSSLEKVGYTIEMRDADTHLASRFGIVADPSRFPLPVTGISEAAHAKNVLRVGDELLAIDGLKADRFQLSALKNKEETELTFFRNGELKKAEIKHSGEKYYNSYRIVTSENPSQIQLSNRKRWLS